MIGREVNFFIPDPDSAIAGSGIIVDREFFGGRYPQFSSDFDIEVYSIWDEVRKELIPNVIEDDVFPLKDEPISLSRYLKLTEDI